VAVKANLRACQGFAKKFGIACPIVGVMTGGTFDIPVEKGEYRVEISGLRIMAFNAGTIKKIILMAPVDTDGMVIRQIGIDQVISVYGIGADVTAEAVQCHCAVMAGETNL